MLCLAGTSILVLILPSAGVTAIVKTAMLPNLFRGDMCRCMYPPICKVYGLLDNVDTGVQLVIWDVAEVLLLSVQHLSLLSGSSSVMLELVGRHPIL